MANDKLYKLAAEFYQRKLWLDMEEEEIFGVVLPSGEIAYCSVIGRNGIRIALAVYVGNESFETYRRANFPMEPVTDNEWIFNQVGKNCLLCSFETRENLSDDELTAEKFFCKRNKIFFRAKSSHPRFLKCEPYVCEDVIDTQEDEEILTLALSAAVEVGEKYPENLPRNIAFPDFPPIRKQFPILTPSEDKFIWKMATLPPYRYGKYPVAKFKKADIAKIKKAEKSGTFDCELFVLSNPLSDVKDKFFRFPVFLLTVNGNKKPVEVPLTLNYASKPEELTENFIFICLKVGVPEKICVRNDRTYSYFEKFCEEGGIELCEVEEMSEIDAWELGRVGKV